MSAQRSSWIGGQKSLSCAVEDGEAFVRMKSVSIPSHRPSCISAVRLTAVSPKPFVT